MINLLKLFIIITCLHLNIAAQYEIRVVNQKITKEGFLFDLAIKSTEADFLLGSYQCIFGFNNNLLKNTQLEFRYLESTSQLNNAPAITSIEVDEDTAKLCLAAGAGKDTIFSGYRRIGTFALLGINDNQDSLNLQWSFNGNIRTILADAEFNDISIPQNHIIEESPLPVELLTLNAVIFKESVLLKWETITELNNFGFMVERKRGEDKEYKALGLVKATGGSENQKYSFRDKDILAPGTYKYRLKQMDNDGTYEYLKSIEVVIDKPLVYTLYQNYPNPFNPSTIIKYSLKENSRVELNIFDITGKLIDKLSDNIQESGVHSIEWVAGKHASGIYICQLRTISIESGERFSSIIKLILLK